MGITAECKQAMIEHGVATNNGVPAGQALMNSDVIRIALNGTGFTIQDLVEKVGKPLEVPLWGVEELQTDFAEDYDFEKITAEAISYWYDGEVEFVSPNEDPDIYVFAHKGEIVNGIATMPLNDHPDFELTGYDVSIMSINMQDMFDEDVKAEAVLLDTMTHEFGHTFGIAHPERSIRNMEGEHSHTHVCNASAEAIGKISSYGSETGIMAAGGTEAENFYDQGTRHYVRTGEVVSTVKP